jgi:predicted nucleotidyltransferase
MTYTDLPDAVQDGVTNLSREGRSLGGRMFVFGSFAAGTIRPQSDLDLAFELRAPTSAQLAFPGAPNSQRDVVG